jgi:hypothetical protein
VAKLEDKIIELTSYARKKADGFMQLAERSQNRVENISVILVIVGVFLSALIAFVGVRYVLRLKGCWYKREMNFKKHSPK